MWRNLFLLYFVFVKKQRTIERKKKRSKISGLESCYANRIYVLIGVELRPYGQKLVQFCKHTHTPTHTHTRARAHARVSFSSILEEARASTGLCVDVIYSSVLSFTQFSPTCGRMPLPALLLWPGRQPYRSSLVDGRRGGGPSSVAPRSRNPPTERRRDCPISLSLFSHDPHLCAFG